MCHVFPVKKPSLLKPADLNQSGYGEDGGVYLTGDTTFMHVNGLILNNNEGVNGGGASINDGALLFTKNAIYCWDRKQCNQLKDNRTERVDGKGGAIYLNDGDAHITYAHISENKADEGIVYLAKMSPLWY